MKKYVFATLVIPILVLLTSCAKEKAQFDISLIGELLNKENINTSSNEYPIRQSKRTIPCTMCHQKGVTVYFDGRIIQCPLCYGQGQISIEQLQDLIDSREFSVSRTDCNNEYKQSEIERLERSIASMESQLQYINSETQRVYLSNKIVEMQSELNRLRENL